MLNKLKKTCVALVAVSAIALPVTSASAQQATVVGRMIDGQVYELQSPAPSMSFHAGLVSGTPMALRNDVNSNRPLSVPANIVPPAGTCRLWYPDTSMAEQPSAAACHGVVPRGAVLLLG